MNPTRPLHPASASRRASARRWLLRFSLVAAGVYLAIVVSFICAQRTLVYPALRTGPLHAADHGIPGAIATDIVATSRDGLGLHGWRFQPAKPSRPEAPVLLIFHGNGGHRAQSLGVAELVCSLGCEALVFDYRGYGENAGDPSEAGLTDDARAMWAFATQTLDISPGRIVLYGQSLGGGIAVRLAADLSRAGTPPGGLVLCNTFTSLVDAASAHFPWLPVRLALLDRFDSRGRIGDVKCPLIVLHGDHDRVIDQRLGRQLFAAAPDRSTAGVEKRFVSLAGADHNDMLDAAYPSYRDAVANFLEPLMQSP